MRIAQVSPLTESVPPKQYGGTERVVSWLTEELVRQGHDVTLSASGDSVTSARLVPCCDRALRFDPDASCPIPYHLVTLNRLLEMASEFDVIHFHIDYLHFPLFRFRANTTVTTLHGRLDLPFLVPAFSEFRDMPLVSISDSQRSPLPWANWSGTVYHGLPAGLLNYRENPSLDYLAFLGRISPEKRVDRAIEIAGRAGMRLKIAAKVDKADAVYFDEKIKPLLAQPHVEFIGEIDDSGKAEFLGNAHGLLFPIDWPEPFGLVMIESMACGTPVVAYRCGSVPEVIDNGVTGFVVDDDEEAAVALKRLRMLNRRMVRKRFEERFTVERMACDYVNLYEEMVAPKSRPVRELA